jgi:hypothetical protein
LALDFTHETGAILAILERLAAACAPIVRGGMPRNARAATPFSWGSGAGQHLALFMGK